jgi:hypothetical protein
MVVNVDVNSGRRGRKLKKYLPLGKRNTGLKKRDVISFNFLFLCLS